MSSETPYQGTILIVDDTPTNLGVLFDYLSDFGFEVLVAQDGESAIEKVEYAHPDIILLDVLMPGIDGFETCRRLKANQSTQDIPVVFMTALSETVDKVTGFNVGAVDYVTKPVQHEEVLARIRTHLTIRNLSKQLQDQNVRLQQEIREKERAEQALRQSEARFRRIFKSDMIGLIFWNVDGKVTESNDAFLQMVGYTQADLLSGKVRWQDMTLPEYQHLDEQAAFEVRTSRACTPYEKVLLRKDGSHLPILIGSTFLEGSSQQGVSFVLNISARKQAEQALRESEERFRQLAANIQQVFWMTSPDGKQVLYISPAYEEIWGRTCLSLIQQPSSWLDAIHPEDRISFMAALKKGIKEKRDCEYRIVQPDGSVRWINDRAFPVRDEFGCVYRIAGIAEDITERKRVEEEIHKALEKEKELNLLKSSFVSMTSHEFRSPLSTILFSAGLLQDYGSRLTEEKKLSHLQGIKTSVQRMAKMLDEVLLIGKTDAGKVEFNPAPLDLQAFTSEIVAEMQQTAGTRHRLSFIIQGQCSGADTGLLPLLDEELLRHIFTNLLSNAIKYSPEGGTVHLELSCDREQVIFRIQDEGIGIPLEDQERIFENFHRATNVGTIPGTGLGLAIIKKFVELHKGEITVDSQVGVGTKFTVKLPLQYS